MFTITFNQKTSAYASRNLNDNLTFLRIIETTTNDLFRIRGYSYINDIYEALGVKWNPEWDNLCRIYEEGSEIKFKIARQDESGEIVIDVE